MARSIVLRFDAICTDCGAALRAGTTARWFGKGRVSCCGSPPSILPPHANAAARNVNGEAFGTPDRRVSGPVSMPPAAQPPIALPSPLAEAMDQGLSPDQVSALQNSHPNMLLLVRLNTGARFLAPARFASFIIACIAESCMDKVRDVTRSEQR